MPSSTELDAATISAIDEGRWADLWQPTGDIALLNHGSFGRTFRQVRDLQVEIEREIDTDPAAFYRGDHRDRIPRAADEVGEWLGVGPGAAAVFFNNASMATVTTAGSMLAPGSSLLTTNLGYGGIEVGLSRLAASVGAVHDIVTVDSLADAGDIESLVVERVSATQPAVVVLDQITSATALRFPIESMVAAIRAASPETKVVVDGAHAAGMEVRPVVAGADAWIANLHKWVCAAPGTAVIVANKGDDAGPLLRSWAGNEPFPESHLWLGTDAKASYLAAPLATQTLERLRGVELEEHISSTLDQASRMLSDAWDVPADARPSGMEAPWMGLIEIPGGHSIEWEQLDGLILAVREELKADVVITEFGGTLYLRLSCHAYNTVDQYERLLRLPDVVRRSL